jgi:hypothetical protein
MSPPRPALAPLLFGPYRPSRLRRGDRATCLYRDGTVIVTSLAETRLGPWPRCRLHSTGGGSGLLVNRELARAVRRESAVSVCHWWGMSRLAVWHWRRALGVPELNEARQLNRRPEKRRYRIVLQPADGAA